MKHLPDDLAHEQRTALAAGVEVVERIDAVIHQLEYLKAQHLAVLSHLADRIARDEGHADHGEMVHRAVEAEVAVATRTGHVAVASAMGHAGALLSRYPAVSAALRDGALSLRHTEVIVDAGEIIGAESARAAYEAEVLPLALRMTARQLRSHAARLAERYAERDIDERHREAREGRCVRVSDLPDGMASLVAVIGAVEAYAIKDRLAQLAHATRGAGGGPATVGPAAAGTTTDTATIGAATAGTTDTTGTDNAADTRTLAQVQADVFSELLLSADPASLAGAASSAGAGAGIAAVAGRVQVSVPVLRLMDAGGTDSTAAPHPAPAELAGYGPIDTATARRLAGFAPAWERVLTHPVGGAVLAVDRYRPSEELRRLLGARDEHCRFPGCLRRLDHCVVDHTVPAARGGPTSLGNLGSLCRRHHTLKHFEFLGGSGWRVKQAPGGVFEWSSPSGRRYTDRPSSTVRFRPVAPAEAETTAEATAEAEAA